MSSNPFRSPVPALSLAAALGTVATAAMAAPTVDPAQAMLTIPQAVTIAEVTQNGTAYGLKRQTVGADIVYHVKLSTPDRGVVDVLVNAYGGRVQTRQPDRD